MIKKEYQAPSLIVVELNNSPILDLSYGGENEDATPQSNKYLFIIDDEDETCDYDDNM